MSALVLLCTALAVCWRADAFSAMAPTTALASTATRDLGIGMDDLWTSCLDEVPVPRQMKVEGEIPDYVKGTLLRNGPSVFEALKESGENHRYKHIFDGLARVVSYTFPGDGSVAFSTKLIRSKFHEQVVQRRGDLPAGVTTGGTVPPFSVLKNVLGLVAGPSYDNCNVNIHQIGGSGGPVVAVTDAPAMMPLDNQLNTPGLLKHPNKITTGLGVELFSTAHPHCIPGDKYSYNYYLELKPLGNNLAHIVRTDQHFKRTIVGSVEIGQDVPYIHDFSLTPKHAVLAIWPLSSDVSTTPNGKGFLPQLVWEGNKNTKIYVFDIENSRSQGTQGTQGSQGTQGTQEDVSTPPHAPPPVAVFETEPLFAYHHVNCYERGDGLVLDLLAYKNADMVNSDTAYAYIDSMKSPSKRRAITRAGVYHRLELPLKEAIAQNAAKSSAQNDPQSTSTTSTTSTTTSSSSSCSSSDRPLYVQAKLLHARDSDGLYSETEMVTLNPLLKGRAYRYSYGMTMFPPSVLQQYVRPLGEDCTDWGIVKMDHEAAVAAYRADGAEISTSGSHVSNVSPDGSPTSESPVSAGSPRSPGTSAVRWSSPSCYPSEPIFVPHPQATAEDHGVLLAQVYDGTRREAFLLVLDAQSMQERARCYSGMRLPVQFHGKFIEKF